MNEFDQFDEYGYSFFDFNDEFAADNKNEFLDCLYMPSYQFEDTKSFNKSNNQTLFQNCNVDENVIFPIKKENEQEIYTNQQNIDYLSRQCGNVNMNEIIQKSKCNDYLINKQSKKRRQVLFLLNNAERFRVDFYHSIIGQKFDKKYVQKLHNAVCGSLNLRPLAREEYRSIKLYFKNFASDGDRIIEAIKQYLEVHVEIKLEILNKK